jgi:hypothetical protein
MRCASSGAFIGLLEAKGHELVNRDKIIALSDKMPSREEL